MFCYSFRFDRLIYLDELDPRDRLLFSQHWRWHRLVHVCRRWRSAAFASPNFLGLRLVCDRYTNMELMGIWPSLPVVLKNMKFLPMPEDHASGAAIVPHNRVYEISLVIKGPEWQRLTLAMREQFPALVSLTLCSLNVDSRHPIPTIPDQFLGGSAPRLKTLRTHSISFPTLPNFLLSATHLVNLHLQAIPHSGYMSPEAVVTGLAVSTNLEFLCLEFKSHQSLPYLESRFQPPPTRTVLPALTRIVLKGVSEWLEDVVARIDVPLLDSARITFFHPLMFDLPQLSRFIGHTAMFQALDEAHLVIDNNSVHAGYLRPTQTYNNSSGFKISCEGMDDQLSSLVQVVASFFHSMYMVKDLYIYGDEDSLYRWRDGFEDTPWLEIFHPFTGAKNLYICKAFARRIAPALRELMGERAIDVLPTLECFFVEYLELSGPVQEAFRQFVFVRQLSGHPVALSCWIR